LGKRHLGRRAVILTSALALLGLVSAVPSAGAAGKLQMYEASVSQEQFSELLGGYDVVAPKPTADGVDVDLVLSRAEGDLLSSKGVELELKRDAQGRTVQQRAAAQAAGGFQVYRDYDGPDGLAKFMRQFVKQHKKIAKLKVVGETVQGRDILAVRLTDENDEGKKKGSHKREAPVLYQGTTHAREWISTEVTLRLMEWFASKKPQAKKLVRKRELWFVPVVNPDGYQYTFDGDRLWRKNMRLNNDDGVFNLRDGVDINRNYPEHWNWDDEGSETNTASETYRGPSAASEPETQASIDFIEGIPFRFAVSYHSYVPALLYPEGWQVQTPSRDDPIYIALTGTDEEPAVEGFDPDLSAELYTTNGEFTDWAHGIEKTLAWTPELNEGCEGCGFVFPDDEELVQNEFEINLPFAIDVAKSAKNPAKPKSHLGNTTEPLYLETESLDPTRGGNPLSDFRFAHSYGDPQPVEVLARRRIGKVTAHYRINGGAEQTAPTSEWGGGETYGEAYDVYYHVMRGEVTGTDPGDEVEVWFEAKKKGKTRSSDSFTYAAESDSGAETLVVAAEDYTGISPGDGSGTAPSYLSYFEDALTANGISHDVYDVDAHGRVAPDHLGVLGHFDSVVYYTGDDIITRDVGMVGGTASRLANDEMLELRSYLNEGGRLLYNGQYAGLQYSANGYFFDPVANAPCFATDPNDPEVPLDPEVDARCQFMPDDFLQYYLGAYIYAEDTGTDPDTGNPFDLEGIADPYAGETWSFNGADSAANQGHTASFLTTSSILPAATYPQFATEAPAAWVAAGEAPYEPFDGSQYLYSQRANQSFKRLSRTIDLTGVSAGDAPSITFQTSRDTEPGWDFLFVEAHTPGQDDWTTLPEANGHTATETGDSCGAGWQELHPFLAHYQTDNGDGTCTATGTSGEWNAASGRSPGWEQWEVDLSAYAGQEVELSISYASDWGVQGIGVFLDQIEVSTGEGTTSFEDDGDPMDGWTVPEDPPEGTVLNSNNWLRTGSLGFEEGAIVSTDDTLYFGFGLEGVTGAAERADLLGRSMGYLGP
jgi:hypothetical protein